MYGVISDSSIPEVDETFTPDTFHDTYLNKEVALTRGVNDNCNVQFGKVTKRLRDAEGRPIGMANENPLLDTREYSVEFKDGISESLSTIVPVPSCSPEQVSQTPSVRIQIELSVLIVADEL